MAKLLLNGSNDSSVERIRSKHRRGIQLQQGSCSSAGLLSFVDSCVYDRRFCFYSWRQEFEWFVQWNYKGGKNWISRRLVAFAAIWKVFNGLDPVQCRPDTLYQKKYLKHFSSLLPRLEKNAVNVGTFDNGSRQRQKGRPNIIWQMKNCFAPLMTMKWRVPQEVI